MSSSSGNSPGSLSVECVSAVLVVVLVVPIRRLVAFLANWNVSPASARFVAQLRAACR